MSATTQRQRLLDYLQKNESVTQLEALNDLGIMRLDSRISDLKKDGHKIIAVPVTVKNRYGEPCRIKRYSLSPENKYDNS